jgi:integrase
VDAGIPLDNGADFQHDPATWHGVTWGLVEGFIHWLLNEGYAITSVNARLSTVKVYSQMAVKAGMIDRPEGMLIQTVKGFSRQGGLNVDAKRLQKRKERVSYDYKPAGEKRRVVVNRRSTKKGRPVLLSEVEAIRLKQPQNHSPQAWRDALLLCLLLDHGLRASEAALLRISDFDLESGRLRFYRPKVKGTAHEWTTHQMTTATHEVASYYIERLYPAALQPDGLLLLTTSRLLKDGRGGQLLTQSLSRIRISERVASLGKQLGIGKLSAHDCRHTCATGMARLGYGVDELMAWFGWSSAQTAMRYVAAAEVKERYRG